MKLTNSSRRSALALMLGLSGAAMFNRKASARIAYEFGIFPYLPALKLEHLFAPMAQSFSEVTNSPIQLRTKPTFEEFRDELAQNAYDIALLHPFFLIEAQQHYGYVPIGRVDGQLTGVLLGCRDSHLHGIASLRGKVLALPPRLAGVSYLTIIALDEHGLTPGVDVELRHYRTKVSCLHAVATGDADGCVIPSFMVEQLDAVKRMNLVPIAETRGIPGLALAASTRLERPLREQLKHHILTWNNTVQGQGVLERVRWPRVVEAEPADYAMIGANHELLNKYAMR
ncbi:MAG: phosphate/phosphite/phosphonate ABC transporter substrate-binding protein [Pseudomonadota bacterium]